MDKPKFKLSTREMLAFNDACDDAARHCPQFRGWGPDSDDIIAGTMSAKELVSWWLGCGTLFSYGYSECLCDEAKDIFKQYKLYKAAKKVWKMQQKINKAGN